MCKSDAFAPERRRRRRGELLRSIATSLPRLATSLTFDCKTLNRSEERASLSYFVTFGVPGIKEEHETMSSITPKVSSSPTLAELKALIDGAAGVIFDNDGTVVDSMPVHFAAYQKAVAKYGLRFPKSLFYAWAGVPASVIVAQLKHDQGKLDVDVDALLAAKDEALAELMHTVRPIEPVVTLLRYAKKKGIPVALASGGERKDVVASLEASGVGIASFDAVVTREDVKNGKPDPETFLLAAQRLGVDPINCIGLEDGEKGFQALRNADMVALDARTFEGYPVPVMDDDASK